tara:strand:- start:995 stop:1420 length:426 start_codon:yes stop_codon:yes gene_type:complete
MTRCVLILLFLVSSCSQPETLPDMDDATSIDLDSLADATIKQVHKEKKQKVLLEQDLWRKKRDIKKIEKKYTDSIYELNNLKLISTDSIVYDYKIVVTQVVDSVRVSVSDSLCKVCLAKKKKKENSLVNKAFRWLQQNIEL